MRRLYSAFILLAFFGVAPAFGAAIELNSDYPGANVRVERMEGDTIHVAPDLRHTQKGQWWFYWNFGIRGDAGREVTVVFRDKNPIGVRGPALSLDSGKSWGWMGAAVVKEGKHEGKRSWSFTVTLPASGEARV